MYSICGWDGAQTSWLTSLPACLPACLLAGLLGLAVLLGPEHRIAKRWQPGSCTNEVKKNIFNLYIFSWPELNI